MALTSKEIEAAKYEKSKERIGDADGLYVRLFTSGAKTFQLRAVIGGKRHWLTLGAFPELGLKQARTLATMVRLQIDRGSDLEQVRFFISSGTLENSPGVPEPLAMAKAVAKTMANDMSFRALTKVWFEKKCLGLKNGKHIQQNWNTVETYIFPAFGDKKVADIDIDDVTDAIGPIWRDKHETAKRTLARVKEIFELAKLRKLRTDNPADFSTRVAFGPISKKTKHFGALHYERMQDFWKWLCLAHCQEHTRHMAMLMILTAKRTNESRQASWEFFDTVANVWTTPAELMKMGRLHRVPISRQVAVVLSNMATLSGGYDKVFAKPNNKRGVISENTVLNLVKRFDPNITGHGFRATFRTWSRRQNRYSNDAMEFALAHEQNSLEAAYQREDLIEEREVLMQDWADFVTQGQDPLSFVEIAIS